MTALFVFILKTVYDELLDQGQSINQQTLDQIHCLLLYTHTQTRNMGFWLGLYVFCEHLQILLISMSYNKCEVRIHATGRVKYNCKIYMVSWSHEDILIHVLQKGRQSCGKWLLMFNTFVQLNYDYVCLLHSLMGFIRVKYCLVLLNSLSLYMTAHTVYCMVEIILDHVLRLNVIL